MIGIRELMAAGALAGAVVLALAPAVPDQPVGTADQRPAAEIIGETAQLIVGGISATGVD